MPQMYKPFRIQFFPLKLKRKIGTMKLEIEI